MWQLEAGIEALVAIVAGVVAALVWVPGGLRWGLALLVVVGCVGLAVVVPLLRHAVEQIVGSDH